MNIILNITGMSCGHCAARIQNALRQINGVGAIEISVENQTAAIAYDETKTNPAALISVIEDAGFSAK